MGSGAPGRRLGVRIRAAAGLAPPPAARRNLRSLGLGVLDLLEDLAHPRPQKRSRLGSGVTIASTDARGLPSVEVVGTVWLVAPVDVVSHDGIVGRRGLRVNALGRALAR